jgi:O-antigen ligase
MFVVCLCLLGYSNARAGMVAAGISCGLLCLSLRKYRLLLQGGGIILILIATAAILDPAHLSNSAAELTSTVLYKNGEPSQGMLGSRESPWQKSVDTIRNHFWFGTGFGTEDNGEDASDRLVNFSSSKGITTEHGSSYLALMIWVGMLGVLPFILLLLVIAGKVYRTVAWMIGTGSAYHPAVPLAMIMVAGMAHAGLEDWLFAPGYYLAVFFWTMAFILVDLAPAAPHILPRVASSWRPRSLRQGLDSVAPSR